VLIPPFKYFASSLSNLESMIDAIGLKIVIIKMPRVKEIITAGNKNCHADIPVALATTNSEELVNLEKDNIPPSKIAKGTTF
jgi:hypothetical protein